MAPVQPVKFLLGDEKKRDMIGFSQLDDFAYFPLFLFLLDQYFVHSIWARFNNFYEGIKAAYFFHRKSY